MNKEDIIKYVMHTPQNTNYSVLNSILDQYTAGGENPNYKEVITGTVANPWGSMTEADYNMFLAAYYSGDASAKMVVDASALGVEDPVVLSIDYFYHEPTFERLYLEGATCVAFNVHYYGAFNEGNNLEGIYYLLENGGTITDISPYASMLPTTLTIYWHPMP